jgi:multiple sugar transport system permease protein
MATSAERLRLPSRVAARDGFASWWLRRGGAVAWTPLLFLGPAMAVLFVWTYWPLIEAFRLSFYEWNLLPTAPKQFVGLDNYERILSLAELRRAAINTVYYTVGLWPMTVALPLAIALMTRSIGGRASVIYRALIFTPMVMAPVVVAIIWRWLLNPDHGLVNHALMTLGFDAVRFLQNPSTALPTILFITGWKLVGFSALLFAAGIVNIDRSSIEAARLDGASDWQISRYVIIPLLSPVILFLSMLTVLHGAQWSFVYINVLTQGGPRQSTTNLFYLLWDYGFGTFAIGWSTAAGMLLFAVFGVLAVVCLRLMNRHAVHES